MAAVRASWAALGAVLLLAACDRAEEPVGGQRISLEDARGETRAPLASPDTEDAAWTVSGSGQSIDFGTPGERPFLSLACRVKDDPPTVSVIRHAPARPGEKALFPVIGNGTVARFKADAVLRDNEWRWEATVPADDALLEVFTGRREIEATLPGAGSLMIGGSAIPGEFISWCAKGGAVAQAISEEKADETD
jgi:hypothetical protein